MVNQLAPFLATAPLMAPFRDLLKSPQTPGKKVYWDDQLQKIFETTREEICKLASQGLTFYDGTKKTVLITDWSKVGIGFLLLQKHCNCFSDSIECCIDGWKLVLCRSRHLTSSESQYAPIEGEALAICWASKKACIFQQGNIHFDIIVDHAPLLKIFGDKSLQDITNPRLFALKEKTLLYTFQMKYMRGIKNRADTLSRYPTGKPDEDDLLCSEINVLLTISAIEETSRAVSIDIQTLQNCIRNDKQYELLYNTIQTGNFADSLSLENNYIREFFYVKDRI